MDLQALGKAGQSGLISSVLVLTGVFLTLASNQLSIPFLVIFGIISIIFGFVLGMIAVYLAVKAYNS